MRHRLHRLRPYLAVSLPIVTLLALTGCFAAPDGLYASEAGARASQVPGLIKTTHDGVKLTEAYLVKHPRAVDFTQHMDDGFPLDYDDGYVMYTDSHDSWNDWYVTASYGGGHTDGAYYYNSHTQQYYVCGSKSYLQQNWHLPKSRQSATCPRLLWENVDSEVLAAR